MRRLFLLPIVLACTSILHAEDEPEIKSVKQVKVETAQRLDEWGKDFKQTLAASGIKPDTVNAVHASYDYHLRKVSSAWAKRLIAHQLGKKLFTLEEANRMPLEVAKAHLNLNTVGEENNLYFGPSDEEMMAQIESFSFDSVDSSNSGNSKTEAKAETTSVAVPDSVKDAEDKMLDRTSPAVVKRAAELDSTNGDYRYFNAYQQEQAGDLQGAYEEYRAALHNEREDPKTFAGLARTAFAVGRTQEANEAAWQALQRNPSAELRRIAESYFELSKDRLRSVPSKHADVRGEIVGGVKIGPGSNSFPQGTLDPRSRRSHALMEQALRALRVGNAQEAVALTTRALELNPDNARALNFRSTAFERLGKHAQALDDAESVVALAPGNSSGLLTRAFVKVKLGRFKEALEETHAVLKKNPRSAPALRIASFAQAGLGDREGMLETLKQGASISPALARLYERALQLPQGDELTLLFGYGVITSEGQEPKIPKHPMESPVFWWVIAAVAAASVLAAGWARRRTKPIVEPTEKTTVLPTGFEMAGTLGTGGMGVVYKARDQGTNRFVAIKRLREEIRSDARSVELILKEARAVARLNHPNIVAVFGARRHNQETFLIFEYVEGKTLSSLMAERDTVGILEAVSIMAQACAAIDHAHSRGVVHRDIKPANLMIDTNGLLRVMDFGIARLATDVMTRMTRSTVVAGTPPYMAPEQEEGKARRESDIFSLGVLLYELVTGELPFPGMGAALHLQKREGRFVPPSQRIPTGLPPELDAMIAKAIAPDPADRFSSAGEFSAALKGLLPA
ncbi:MAG: hypothetical protein COB53_03045 [Elusimicrobia bacterium]|nr:MAG: hypothetical protein COB53_03045 [Elusimicrobiota bacterium]